MKKTFSILAVLALLVAAIGVVAMASVSAATVPTIPYPYHETMMNNGHQVFYIIIESDGSIHPASTNEVAGLDAAMADGTLKQNGRDDFLGRGVQ